MTVKVTFGDAWKGRRHEEWVGWYAHSFDAFDEALDRCQLADRIHVRALTPAEVAALALPMTLAQ